MQDSALHYLSFLFKSLKTHRLNQFLKKPEKGLEHLSFG